VSLEAVYAAKASCDVGGHYSRPDILQLLVTNRSMERLVEHNDGQGLPERQDGQKNEPPRQDNGSISENGSVRDVPPPAFDTLSTAAPEG
jgi:hypothetical protein